MIRDLRLTKGCVPSDPPPGLSTPEAYSNSSSNSRRRMKTDRSMRAPAFRTCPSQKQGPLLTCPAEDVKSVPGLHGLASKVLTTRCGLKTEWQSWSPPRVSSRPWGLWRKGMARPGDLERRGHEGL